MRDALQYIRLVLPSLLHLAGTKVSWLLHLKACCKGKLSARALGKVDKALQKTFCASHYLLMDRLQVRILYNTRLLQRSDCAYLHICKAALLCPL